MNTRDTSVDHDTSAAPPRITRIDGLRWATRAPLPRVVHVPVAMEPVEDDSDLDPEEEAAIGRLQEDDDPDEQPSATSPRLYRIWRVSPSGRSLERIGMATCQEGTSARAFNPERDQATCRWVVALFTAATCVAPSLPQPPLLNIVWGALCLTLTTVTIADIDRICPLEPPPLLKRPPEPIRRDPHPSWGPRPPLSSHEPSGGDACSWDVEIAQLLYPQLGSLLSGNQEAILSTFCAGAFSGLGGSLGADTGDHEVYGGECNPATGGGFFGLFGF